MAKRAKSTPSRSKTSPKPSVPTDEAPKYTWSQLDAAFPPPTEEERAVFDVSVTDDHQRAGAEIASARILTDAQRWLGQLHDASQRNPNALGRVFGYDPALARVFAGRVRRLRTLVAASEGSASTRRLRRSAAEAIFDASVKASRARYREVLAALSGAVATDATRRAQVSALRSEPGVDALSRDLGALAQLVDDAIAAKSPVRARALGRQLDAAVARELRQLATQVDQAFDGVSGANRHESVSQREIDREDGALLTLMEELMGLFPKGGGADLPALLPIATRRYFSSSRRRSAPALEPAPVPTPGPV